MSSRIPSSRAGAPAITEEDAFGVIEVVVAMFLLAVIAVAIVPILVQGLRLSVQNAVLASSTQLANQQMEQVRGLSACGAVTSLTTTSTAEGVPLKATRTIGTACPATGYPLTVRVSVTVARTDTNAVITSATTLVFVTGP